MRYRPALQVVLTFAAAILLGMIGLRLFGFSDLMTRPPWLTAAFTATSAVCVTGLSVIDLGRDLSGAGQVLLLVLIQIGGLGVLTLSNWILLFLRGRVTLHGGLIMRDTMGDVAQVSPGAFLKRIVLFTASVEAIGAVVLFTRFVWDHGFAQALWLAVFHSVSAFCNAGFSLFSDSLVSYRGDWLVNATIMSLIVLGGIGYVVAVEVGGWMLARKRRQKRWNLSLHSRIVVVTTALLIFGGSALILVMEWHGPAFQMAWHEKILSATFLSVTSRTAGFNTLDTGQLTNATLLFVIFLMFIGASPASTGGGVKTTTAVIVLHLVRSWINNRPRVEVGGRSIPHAQVSKALAVAALQASIAFIGVLLLQLTEFGAMSHAESRGYFLGHLFEVVSAIGTVGLSTGVTPYFTPSGHCVLILMMFVGRVGPLVLASSIIGEKPEWAYVYPEEEVLTG